MPGQIILDKVDFERMKASVLPSADDFSREEKRKHLKKLSNDRMKNWPNTLEAMRLKKESFMKDKDEKEEARRRVLDVEVSTY